GRVGFLASGLAVEFRLSPKLSGWVIPEVAVSETVGDTVAGVDIALLDTNGKELYVVRNKSLKARRGALVAGATLKIRDLDSGNYAFAVSYKDSGGKVMAKVKRPVQWREKGRGRISGKFWSRVKRGEVKKAATIFTPQLLATARENIRKYPWAKAMRAKAVARAEPILKVPVEKFLDLMPSPNMVRKYDKVCPYCGHTSMGTAPVVGILSAPWESRCIICGKSLPGFDAKRWFLSGKDERGWFDPGKADDSLLPKEAKFRETAILAMQNYCSAYWPSFRHVVNNLRHAYAFTGDERYGRYALILLGRFADFYPYFSADDVHDDTHPGALMQDTSECAFLQDMALAYDTCFSLVADSEVLGAVSRYRQRWSLPPLADSVALQQHIEGNVFGIPPEERGDRMDVAGKMNKNVMVRIVNTNASRGHVAPQAIAQVFKGTPIGEAYDEEARKLAFGGFNEDGSNIEGSMEYDLWGFWYIVNHHRELMRLVPDAPGNIWKDKTVLAAYEHYFDLYCLGRYFPHFGDTWGRAAPAAMLRASYIGPNPNRYVREENKEIANHYAQVFAATGIERFALIAQYLNGGTTEGLRMSIFDADPEGIQEKVRAVVEKKRTPLERSSVAPVFGVAMLKAGEGDNRRALWLRTNRRVQLAEGGWHGHNDSMNIGLFGYGLNLLPDGEKFDLKRWIFGHNTVSRQETPLPHFGKRLPPHAPDDSLPKPILAEIDFLAEFPGMQAVRAVGINSKESRRTVFLTDVGADRFYVLDSLRVAPDIPEDYVTYCFRTMQGKITKGIGEKVSKDKFVGRSRTGGYWLEPLIEAPKDMGKGPWSIEVAIDDTYKVLEKPSDVKLRLTCLRPVDRIWHAWYKAVEGLPMKPRRVPYWFMTLGRPTAPGMPRRFTTLIEPYRDAKPVRVVQVLHGSGKDADII
ncbi:MAG: hypothetical protein QF662_01345, partial [Phycisphaerae bacterium]|nr:hypothetical protein [Phycisphaerae bacterium]